MEVVELNVGGRLFTTTRSTLCKHTGSMLAAMFSGDMQPGLQDSQGRYFIDRNGDWFAVILSYLREEPVRFPAFGTQRQALAAEARYYQLQDLEHQLQIGLPGAQHADPGQSEELDFKERVSKLAYHEGRAALYKSATFVLGAKRVQKICEALVQVFFFRDKQVTDGKQWIDSDSQSEGRGNMTLIDPAEAMQDHIDETQKTYVKDAQDLAEVVGKVAGMPAQEMCGLLKTYTAVFVQELKDRGFELRQSNHSLEYNMRSLARRNGPTVIQWTLAPLFTPNPNTPHHLTESLLLYFVEHMSELRA